MEYERWARQDCDTDYCHLATCLRSRPGESGMWAWGLCPSVCNIFPSYLSVSSICIDQIQPTTQPHPSCQGLPGQYKLLVIINSATRRNIVGSKSVHSIQSMIMSRCSTLSSGVFWDDILLMPSQFSVWLKVVSGCLMKVGWSQWEEGEELCLSWHCWLYNCTLLYSQQCFHGQTVLHSSPCIPAQFSQ